MFLVIIQDDEYKQTNKQTNKHIKRVVSYYRTTYRRGDKAVAPSTDLLGVCHVLTTLRKVLQPRAATEAMVKSESVKSVRGGTV